jgi:hypothetical protein
MRKKREGKRNRLHKKSERRPSSSQEAKKLNSISLLPSYFLFFSLLSFHFIFVQSISFIFFPLSIRWGVPVSSYFIFFFSKIIFFCFLSVARTSWLTNDQTPASQTNPNRAKKEEEEKTKKKVVSKMLDRAYSLFPSAFGLRRHHHQSTATAEWLRWHRCTAAAG